jgi:hypothetical protein
MKTSKMIQQSNLQDFHVQGKQCHKSQSPNPTRRSYPAREIWASEIKPNLFAYTPSSCLQLQFYREFPPQQP